MAFRRQSADSRAPADSAQSASELSDAPGSDIRGRLAIVIRGARGIEQAIALRLSAAGARVLATDRDAAALETAFGGPSIERLELDVTATATTLADSVLERFGQPELIVNNVGITTSQGFLELAAEDFDTVFTTNLRGPWFLTQGLVRGLIRSGRGGNLVFISSLHDHRIRLNPHYSASKAAISMLVRELAFELAPHGIRVNAISPG